MGLNAFFTFTAVAALKIPWQEALGAVFWSGIFFLLLTLLNIRLLILRAIPRPLRYAIAGGIGLFITLIGLVNAGFIIHHPATLVGIGHLGPAVLTFLAGLLFTAVLVARKIKGAILYGILFTTVCAWPIGRWWGTAAWSLAGSVPLVKGSGWWAAPRSQSSVQARPPPFSSLGFPADHIFVHFYRSVRQPSLHSLD